MKLTTKRNRWYFWRELFLYMIPMILIAWSIDVFTSFMQCPIHPEWSAPCEVIWLNAAVYWIFLILIVIFAIISSRMLRKVKKQIEKEFVETANKEKMKEKRKNPRSKILAKKTDDKTNQKAKSKNKK